MKTKSNISRRALLQGTAAVAGTMAASRLMTGNGLFAGEAHAQLAGEKPALLAIFLNGGYNAVFCSADSFRAAGTFGVTGDNIMRSLGNGLVVDAPTFGTFSPYVLGHMSTIGIRHGITSHGAAQQADWTTGTRSYPLMLAAAMGGDASIKCAVVGSQQPAGVKPPENGVSMQVITDMSSTIAALGGATDPTIPDRKVAAGAITASQAMSQRRMLSSPVQLTSMREGFAAAIDTLNKPQQQFNFGTMARAYGLAATTRTVNNFTTKMLAAELMITAGANVVIAIDGGWDTHGDRTAANVRNMMNTRILPPLKTFISRVMDPAGPNAAGRNVVVAIFGDFARSLPGSDHASALSGTVIGKYVRVGTTGKMAANVSLPTGTPSVGGFWAYLAAVLKSPTNPFGANPHDLVL